MRAAHALFTLRSSLGLGLGLGLATLLSLAACVREGAPVVAPVDISIEGADAGAASLVISPPSPTSHDPQRCTARLRALPIKTNPSCQLDERISKGNGTLFYPCAGDGPVEAVFGEHTFQGRLTSTSFVLALTTELEWDDHCQWETKQNLRGTWNREPAKRATLAWSYSERPTSGTNCFGSCTATADIEIDDVSAR